MLADGWMRQPGRGSRKMDINFSALSETYSSASAADPDYQLLAIGPRAAALFALAVLEENRSRAGTPPRRRNRLHKSKGAAAGDDSRA
jgi:hypothetical protein